MGRVSIEIKVIEVSDEAMGRRKEENGSLGLKIIWTNIMRRYWHQQKKGT